MPWPPSTREINSVGLVRITGGEQRADRVIADASLALYEAKRAGGAQFVTFDPSLRDAADRRQSLRQQLPGAFDLKQIEVRFQPIIELAHLRCVGFCVLPGWCPQDGLSLTPNEIITLVTEIGLLDRLTEHLIGHALECIEQWQALEQWDANIQLLLKVNRRQLLGKALSDHLTEALSSYRTDPHALCIAISEADLCTPHPTTLKALQRLSGQGVGIGVSEVGAGNLSLSVLADLAPDMLTIDGSIVSGAAFVGKSQAVIRSIIGMAGGWGGLVLAEGVNNAPQHDGLAGLACDRGCGDNYAQPLVADQVVHWLEAWREARGIKGATTRPARVH